MKSVRIAVVTLIFVYWCQLFCSAGPAIQLHVGENTVAVSIMNGWNCDLAGVSAYVKADELPSWLTIDAGSALVHVRRGETAVLNLDFMIDETTMPQYTVERDITLRLRDNKGNEWAQDMTVQLGSAVPLETRLIGNFPNPCNPSTVIKYSIGKPGTVKLNIYNIQGQKIRTLVNNRQEPGVYDVRWDGSDDRGNHAASGMYLYRLETGGYATSKKIMLVQ